MFGTLSTNGIHDAQQFGEQSYGEKTRLVDRVVGSQTVELPPVTLLTMPKRSAMIPARALFQRHAAISATH
jgi:hypothetical protein